MSGGEALTEVIARNDAATFTAFLEQLDRAVPPGREIHVVLDNGPSRTARHTRAWLAAHPRWRVHWTPPHASRLNQAELFFSALTRRVLRHGAAARGEADLGSAAGRARCGRGLPPVGVWKRILTGRGEGLVDSLSL
ncbi:transposase [Streptomyces sp. NPDC059169]|uniref:transposase n=1 Tax=unclassified Streptomyces TaxID=2593676 RepID=UPI0036CF297E